MYLLLISAVINSHNGSEASGTSDLFILFILFLLEREPLSLACILRADNLLSGFQFHRSLDGDKFCSRWILLSILPMLDLNDFEEYIWDFSVYDIYIGLWA